MYTEYFYIKNTQQLIRKNFTSGHFERLVKHAWFPVSDVSENDLVPVPDDEVDFAIANEYKKA